MAGSVEVDIVDSQKSSEEATASLRSKLTEINEVVPLRGIGVEESCRAESESDRSCLLVLLSLSLLFRSELCLLLLFAFAFVFASLVAHVCVSWIEVR